MSLRRPTASLTLAGQAMSGPEAGLTELRVELSAGVHDRFAAAVLRGSRAGDVAPGASAELALGYGDALETVLTGEVTGVAKAPWGATIEGLGTSIALSRARTGASY